MCEESYISSTAATGTADEVEFEPRASTETFKGICFKKWYVSQFNALDGWMDGWMNGWMGR